MFIAVWIILLFAAWWVPYRSCKLLNAKTRWASVASTAIILALFGSFAGLMASGRLENIAPLGWLANLGGLFFMFFVYWFLLMLLEFGLHRWLKKYNRDAWCAAILPTLALLLVVTGWIHAQTFAVTAYEFPIAGLRNPVTIMHIPDLHLGTQRNERYLQQVVNMINEHKPDMVLYNGDLADSNCALRPELFAIFRQVQSRQFFTTGNHEYYIDTARVLSLLEQNGVEILRNRAVEVHGLELIGLEYMNADRQTIDAHQVNDLTVEEELPKIVRNRKFPSLLLHHTPRGAEYVAQADIDLMLSGHTHNGQVFPGNLLVRMMFPHSRGIYKIGNTTLLISQGAGTFGPWMRLGTSNEIQFIRLVPA